MATSKDRKHSQSQKSKAVDSNIDNITCNECEEPCLEEDKLKICCDACKKWFHKGCTNIKNSEWKLLISNPNILYSCDICLTKKGNEVSDIREIKELLKENLAETKRFMTNLEEKIYQNVDKIIEEKIGKHTKTQEKLESMMREVKEVETNLGTKIKEEVKQHLEHENLKESKKNNLIILRLPEQETEDPTEEQEKDETAVKKIFDTTNPELKAEMEKVLQNNKIKRLGKKKNDTTKPRPIKVTLPDTEMKTQIFRGCKNLRDSAFRNISIQNDLTFEEREANFKLRQQLRERKEKGEEVCIFKGQIIPVKDHPAHRK